MTDIMFGLSQLYVVLVVVGFVTIGLTIWGNRK